MKNAVETAKDIMQTVSVAVVGLFGSWTLADLQQVVGFVTAVLTMIYVAVRLAKTLRPDWFRKSDDKDE